MSFSSQNLRDLNPWADPWWSRVVSAAADEIDRLNAENARLQKALQDIFEIYGEDLPAGEIAVAVIAKKEEKS